MRIAFHASAACLAIVALPPQVALAGMPSITLSDVARMRFQTISFFLLGIVLSAWAVRGLWNSLQRDFHRLPQLSFGKAVGVVLLWGLLSIVVLTMISGARELMTPGAWKKQGLTYQLASDAEQSGAPSAKKSAIALRQEHLEQLRIALWQYAGNHDRRFPPSIAESSIPPQAWQLPDSEGMPYSYVPGLSEGKSTAIVAFEPRIYGDDQFVLQANGEIVRMPSDKIRAALEAEGKP